MEKRFMLLILYLHQSACVIYKLDDADYKLMPPINEIDDYDSCFQDSDALYCTMKLKLVSDTPNNIMDLIANYSAWDVKHFDHSKLYRGVCVTRTCNMNKQEVTMNLDNSLEMCVNESLWKNYKLKAKLLASPNCYSTDRNIQIDSWDIIVGSICVLIIIVNVVATLYDVYVYKKCKTKGMNIFLSFSIIRTWSRLQQNDYRMKHPVERLKGMDGLRSVIMIHFVFGHALIPLVMIIANHHDFEKVITSITKLVNQRANDVPDAAKRLNDKMDEHNIKMYSNLSSHILLNGSLMVQAYFVMAGILLSYNMQMMAERQTLTWKTITTNLFKRWLRLSPSFLICLAISCTWMRHLASGPLWQIIRTREVEDCRRHWMWNFFFLTNYNSGSHCMPQSWYLAADMHLFCFGAIVFVLVTNKFWRKVILASAFLMGTISSGIVTYLYDFRSLMIIKPNLLVETFVKDPNFDYLYKPTHTNIQSYVIGQLAGVYIYRLQKESFDIQKYKKLLVPYWLLLPSIYGLIMLSSIHYRDGPPLPLYIRVLHQMLLKPLISVIFVLGIIGLVFKMESVYRGILEWDGWIWVARVSYTTYITHFTVMRLIIGNWKTLIICSKYILVQAGWITAVSFAVGVIVWLLIDGPVSHIVQICMENPTKHKQTAKQK